MSPTQPARRLNDADDWFASTRSTASRSRSQGAADAKPLRTSERRQRERHLRLVRRDLLVDCLLALLLTIAMLVITAGLGVIALLEIPAAAAAIASCVIERRRRRAPPSAHRHRSRRRA